jgi:hypothetical protein
MENKEHIKLAEKYKKDATEKLLNMFNIKSNESNGTIETIISDIINSSVLFSKALLLDELKQLKCKRGDNND